MKKRIIRLCSVILLASAFVLASAITSNAQDRKVIARHHNKREVVVKHNDRHNVVVKHNDGREVVIHNNRYSEVVVNRRTCYYREGYFYDRRHDGVVKIEAPIGARVTVIPTGYKVIRLHRVRYYVFAGVYYRFIPSSGIYVVVKAPL